MTSSASRGSVEKWLSGLSDEHLRSVAKEIKLLEEAGSDLRLPHSRALGGGIFELREKRFGYRIYYAFKGNKLIVLLAAGDKNSQERDIKAARERLTKG